MRLKTEAVKDHSADFRELSDPAPEDASKVLERITLSVSDFYGSLFSNQIEDLRVDTDAFYPF